MSVIYVLLSISLLVAIIFFAAFIVSIRRGQYDDTYTPSVRILFEDELVKPPKILGPGKTRSFQDLETKKNQSTLKKEKSI